MPLYTSIRFSSMYLMVGSKISLPELASRGVDEGLVARQRAEVAFLQPILEAEVQERQRDEDGDRGLEHHRTQHERPAVVQRRQVLGR